MSISCLSLRDFEYLVAVTKTKHFGTAAKSLHVSQPTLSAQIKKIESFLGVVLFERSNRHVVITEVGRKVADQAQQVLDEATKIISISETSKRTLEGGLRLGAISTLGPFFIPRFLGPLRKKYPLLNLNLKEGLTDSLLEDLRKGDLDAVLAARTFHESGFKVFSIFFESFVLATPFGHRLSKKKALRVSDLRLEEMLLLEDGHCLRDQALDTCPANSRGNIHQFHATSVETLRHLVASGLGYTLLPKLAVYGHPMKNLVSYCSFKEKFIGREIVLVCIERYPAVVDIERLAKFLRLHCPAEVAKS